MRTCLSDISNVLCTKENSPVYLLPETSLLKGIHSLILYVLVLSFDLRISNFTQSSTETVMGVDR